MSAPVTSGYRGRFAPSPTGPLHLGSLVAAVASYLDARSQGGAWLVRMEDLDTPRIVPGASDAIMKALTAHGMTPDEPVVFQSERGHSYQNALENLIQRGRVYPCTCSRREIADSAVRGIEGPVYPGFCRDGVTQPGKPQAWRLRTTDAPVAFRDRIQGEVEQHVGREVGDFVLKRADGVFTYQLAAVIDDAAQGITHVVRGADLLHSTPRQMYLQTMLSLPHVEYAHVPVLVDAKGGKLSKKTGAAAIESTQPVENLKNAMIALGWDVPSSIDTVEQFWAWAVRRWSPSRVRPVLDLEWQPGDAG